MNITMRQLFILKIFDIYKSFARKDVLLGKKALYLYSDFIFSSESELETAFIELIDMGLLSKNKAGSVSLTDKGFYLSGSLSLEKGAN